MLHVALNARNRLITRDGRDVTESDWRPLPEFPTYEINEDTDVRRVQYGSHHIIQSCMNGNSYSYTLYDRYGRKTSRNYWKLFITAFPEYDKGWRDIPGHGNYQVNQDGEVRGKFRRKKLPKTRAGSYILRKDGQRVTWRVMDIKNWDDFWSVPSELKEAA